MISDAPPWTLDQVAGLAFGVSGACAFVGPVLPECMMVHPTPLPMHVQGILLASVFLATRVDRVVARAQRRELGLCEECGGLYEPGSCREANCPMRSAELK